MKFLLVIVILLLIEKLHLLSFVTIRPRQQNLSTPSTLVLFFTFLLEVIVHYINFCRLRFVYFDLYSFKIDKNFIKIFSNITYIMSQKWNVISKSYTINIIFIKSNFNVFNLKKFTEFSIKKSKKYVKKKNIFILLLFKRLITPMSINIYYFHRISCKFNIIFLFFKSKLMYVLHYLK